MGALTLATRRLVVLTAGVAAFMVVALGVVWACTPQAGIRDASPNTAAPGTSVTVRGNEYRPEVAIEFRWGARTGPMIGSTTTDATGSFVGTATIPDDAEARETLLYAVEPGTSVGGEGAVMIRVIDGDEAEPAPEPETSEEPEPTPQPSTEESEPAPGPETSEEPEPVPQPSDGQPEPAQESRDEASEPEPADQAAPPAPEGERQQIGGERQQVGGEPQGERQQVGASELSADEGAAQPAPRASAEPADPARAEPAPAEPAPADPAPAEESADREPVETSGPVSLGPDQVDRGTAAAPEAAPSERSAGGDLWSGVAPSEAPSLMPEGGYDAAGDGGHSGPGQLVVGLALFGAGLTVLLAGAGVPALRRRAVAQARATRSE